MAGLKRIPNAAAAEAAAAIAANNTTTIYAKRNTTNLINNINTMHTTQTMTTTTNTTLLSNNSSSRRLLMKNQLHLNLNVIDTLNVDNDDNELNSTMDKGKGTETGEWEQQTSVRKVEWDGVNVETVTTVPQQQQPQPHEQKQLLEAEEYSKYEEAISVGGQSSTTVRRMAAATSLSSSPSSLLNSSSTALAKFNRIIDSTMPATNYYQHEQEQSQQQQRQIHADDAASTAVLSEALQQRLALVYPDIVSTDSQTKKINFATTKTAAAAAAASTTTHAAKPKAKVKAKSIASQQERLRTTRTETTMARRETQDDQAVAAAAASNDDNQMKRNDVHYLLKQLNSFSDIEEIEIVDMEQTQRQLDEQQQRLSVQQQEQLAQEQQQQQQQFLGGGGGGVDNKSQSPTAQSLVIISPSALSHKGIRRYASLHQQQCSAHYYTLDSDEALDNIEQQQQYLLQQFDDYLFQSCHYLETNSFAANYRTAMVESSSHEFRPSTTTPSTNTRTGTSSGAASVSSEQSLELHETEPPSVICKATPPPPPSEAAASQVPVASPAKLTSPPLVTAGLNMPTSVVLPALSSPPTKRYGMQARLTSSGVQTELTAASAITPAASLPKSASSSASSSEGRRAPFFKCCYTPIDRWREKRSAAHTAQKRSSRRSTDKQTEREVGVATAAVSDRVRRSSSGDVVVAQSHTRKNGHAV